MELRRENGIEEGRWNGGGKVEWRREDGMEERISRPGFTIDIGKRRYSGEGRRWARVCQSVSPKYLSKVSLCTLLCCALALHPFPPLSPLSFAGWAATDGSGPQEGRQGACITAVCPSTPDTE